MLRYELYHCQITDIWDLSPPCALHVPFVFSGSVTCPFIQQRLRQQNCSLPGSHATLALFSFIPSDGQVHRGTNVVTSPSLFLSRQYKIHDYADSCISLWCDFYHCSNGREAASLNTEISFKFGFACLFIHTNSLRTTISFEDTPSYLHISLLIQHSCGFNPALTLGSTVRLHMWNDCAAKWCYLNVGIVNIEVNNQMKTDYPECLWQNKIILESFHH